MSTTEISVEKLRELLRNDEILMDAQIASAREVRILAEMRHLGVLSWKFPFLRRRTRTEAEKVVDDYDTLTAMCYGTRMNWKWHNELKRLCDASSTGFVQLCSSDTWIMQYTDSYLHEQLKRIEKTLHAKPKWEITE